MSFQKISPIRVISVHKRFVDSILLEVCKDTSHHVRVELKNCEEHLTFTI